MPGLFPRHGARCVDNISFILDSFWVQHQVIRRLDKLVHYLILNRFGKAEFLTDKKANMNQINPLETALQSSI